MALPQFDDFESLYGKHYVTMNIHLLRHLSDAVIYLGPLWSQSMFAFEQSNGELVSLVNGPTDVLNQITEKYILRKTLQPDKQFTNNPILECQKLNIEPHAEEETALRQFCISSNKPRTYWTSLKINGEKYSSISHKKMQSNDYFVRLNNNQIGQIQYYIKSEEDFFALVETFIIVGNKNHLYEVISNQSTKAFRCEEIQESLIYFEIGSKEIVCAIPNRHEKT